MVNQMSKIKMTKEEFDKRALEVMMRSCWNCNSAHKHLKKADYIIWCFECGKLYLKGKEIEIIGVANEDK